MVPPPQAWAVCRVASGASASATVAAAAGAGAGGGAAGDRAATDGRAPSGARGAAAAAAATRPVERALGALTARWASRGAGLVHAQFELGKTRRGARAACVTTQFLGWI